MPLTEKGQEIMSNMKEQYGEKKGESVFYASKNAGTISGVDDVVSSREVGIGNPFLAEPFGLPGAATRVFGAAPVIGGGMQMAPACGMDAILAWGANYDLHADGPDDGPKATPDIAKGSGL